MMNRFRIPAGRVRERESIDESQHFLLTFKDCQPSSLCQRTKNNVFSVFSVAPTSQPAMLHWFTTAIRKSVAISITNLDLITCGHSSFLQGSGQSQTLPVQFCTESRFLYSTTVIVNLPWIPFKLFFGNPWWRNLCSEVIYFVFEFILNMFYIKNWNLNAIKWKHTWQTNI